MTRCGRSEGLLQGCLPERLDCGRPSSQSSHKPDFELTDAAGFERSPIAFITAYQDSESAGFKKTVAQLAWGTLAWFASEPEHVLLLREGRRGSSLQSILYY